MDRLLMPSRAQALCRTPRRAIGLVCVLVPWAGAIAFNAWERRDEILTWLKART